MKYDTKKGYFRDKYINGLNIIYVIIISLMVYNLFIFNLLNSNIKNNYHFREHPVWLVDPAYTFH